MLAFITFRNFLNRKSKIVSHMCTHNTTDRNELNILWVLQRVTFSCDSSLSTPIHCKWIVCVCVCATDRYEFSVRLKFPLNFREHNEIAEIWSSNTKTWIEYEWNVCMVYQFYREITLCIECRMLIVQWLCRWTQVTKCARIRRENNRLVPYNQ